MGGFQYKRCPDCGMLLGKGKGKHGLGWHNCGNANVIATLEAEIVKLRETLKFYADPRNYFAIGFLPDPPAGEFMDDFSDTPELGQKPGKRARVALGMETEDA